MTFEQEIILTVIDSLAIAVIVALAGFLLNKSLEKYKSGLELSKIVAQKKIDAISECWTVLYQWDATVETFISTHSEFEQQTPEYKERHRKETLLRLGEISDKSKSQSHEIRDKIESCRFWLGENIYNKFRSYYNSIGDCLDAYSENDFSKFSSLKENMNKMRSDVTSVLKGLE